ncbi:ATP-binding protein [Crossiella cryophila]|uniref:Uncharacterized protein n=1 Tax=Crossiella cryophila TaxID=43355 RepID=A0A7W7C6R7_9PSEU|nr:ATP-binding protein [Crossiella cryophila]MBB4675582.1 hypothetical protein [Crossiella cryophila]
MSGNEKSLLGRRVQAMRERAFIGREAQLSAFTEALAGTGQAASVLFAHGPGGIGKSTLLRRFGQVARSAGRTVVEIDGRITGTDPGQFANSAQVALADERAVLLVDDFDACAGLADWLREDFLTRLPIGVVTVLAGRRPPGSRWLVDPGWAGLFRPLPVRDLAPPEAATFLGDRGVPAKAIDALLSFTGGNPLALALAAALAQHESAPPADWTPGHGVLEALLPQLIGELPSALHRRALEVCAHARVTTEGLLRAVLGEAAAELFGWLRGLPFVAVTERGLYPSPVVRAALEADLRWRDPDAHQTMHGQIREHLRAAVQTATNSAAHPAARVTTHAAARAEALPLIDALLYLRRDPAVRATHTFRDAGSVRELPYTPAEHATVLALTEAAEGPDAADLARYWLARQPEAFRLYQCTRTSRVIAFAAWLRLADQEGTDTDPVVAAAWAHARATAPLREGETLAVARFAVHPESYQRPSPVLDLMRCGAIAETLRPHRIAWTYTVLRDPEFWTPHLTHWGNHPVPDRPTVGEYSYTLFARDWRSHSTPPRLTSLRGTAAQRPGPRGLIVLTRPEFDSAVRDALRCLRDAEAHTANPLTHSRLVAETRTPLNDLLLRAIQSLREDRGGEKYHRAVTATYTRGAPTQEAAASRLGLPFSTYRRHLQTGLSRLCDVLWDKEIHGEEQPVGKVS